VETKRTCIQEEIFIYWELQEGDVAPFEERRVFVSDVNV
jgi:hypothetical protein